MSTIILVHSFWEIDEKFSLLILASFSHHYHLLLPFLPKENFSRIFNTTDIVCLPVLYIYMYMCVHMCMYVLHVLCIFIHMYIYICTLYVKWVRFFVLFCFVFFWFCVPHQRLRDLPCIDLYLIWTIRSKWLWFVVVQSLLN
jgi:hypothetical protein